MPQSHLHVKLSHKRVVRQFSRNGVGHGYLVAIMRSMWLLRGHTWCLLEVCHMHPLKGKFSSGIEGALASKLNRDFNWKQLSEIILCIFLLMFSKFI